MMQELFQSAPTVTQRIVFMQEAAKSVLLGEAIQGPLHPLLSRSESPQRILQIGTRRIVIDVPERGQDGAYIITIEGDPTPLLQAGLDKYAHQYRFHRISEPIDTVQMTIEWQAGDNLQDALHLVYFCQLLLQLLQSMDSRITL